MSWAWARPRRSRPRERGARDEYERGRVALPHGPGRRAQLRPRRPASPRAPFLASSACISQIGSEMSAASYCCPREARSHALCLQWTAAVRLGSKPRPASAKSRAITASPPSPSRSKLTSCAAIKPSLTRPKRTSQLSLSKSNHHTRTVVTSTTTATTSRPGPSACRRPGARFRGRAIARGPLLLADGTAVGKRPRPSREAKPSKIRWRRCR
jgi:hypothetical protein